MAHRHSYVRAYTLKADGKTMLTEQCSSCGGFNTRDITNEQPKKKKTITFKQTDYR